MCRPYSVLLPVGFTVPGLLPGPRCALAAPFRPYPSENGRNAFCGTIPEPPSPRLGSPPGVTRHRGSMEPGLSSPGTSPRRGRPALWRARYRRTTAPLRVRALMARMGGKQTLRPTTARGLVARVLPRQCHTGPVGPPYRQSGDVEPAQAENVHTKMIGRGPLAVEDVDAAAAAEIVLSAFVFHS